MDSEPQSRLLVDFKSFKKNQFTVIHCLGRQHGNADTMSRIHCHQCGFLPNDPNLLISAVTISTVSLSAHSPAKLSLVWMTQLFDFRIRKQGNNLQCLQQEVSHTADFSSYEIILLSRVECSAGCLQDQTMDQITFS